MGGVSETHFPPEFREIPSDIKVPVGHAARFDCIVTGTPNPDLFWFCDGQEVIHLAGSSMGRKRGRLKVFSGPATFRGPAVAEKIFLLYV